jgi:hypothetical protein
MKRFFHLLFMPCEGISAHISESLDRELSPVERFAVGLHTLYCRACHRYRAHILTIRQILDVADEALCCTADMQLRNEARERIINAIRSS